MDATKGYFDRNMVSGFRTVNGIPCNAFISEDGKSTFLLLPDNRGIFLPNAAAVCERGDISPSTPAQQVCEERRGPGHEIKGPSNGVGPATFPNKMKSKISDADLLQRKKQSEADKAKNAHKLEELKRLKKVRRHEQRVKKKSERAQHLSQRAPKPLNAAAEEFALNSAVLRPPLPPLSASGDISVAMPPPPIVAPQASEQRVSHLSSVPGDVTAVERAPEDELTPEEEEMVRFDDYLELVFEMEGPEGLVDALRRRELVRNGTATVGSAASSSTSLGASRALPSLPPASSCVPDYVAAVERAPPDTLTPEEEEMLRFDDYLELVFEMEGLAGLRDELRLRKLFRTDEAVSSAASSPTSLGASHALPSLPPASS
jgi:predicted DNA-binding protein (UPF0251 family)